MAVEWVREIPEGGDGDEGAKRSKTRTFKVKVSLPTDGKAEIDASGMIPGAFSLYDGMLCKYRKFDRTGKGYKFWKVSVEYSTDVTQNAIDAATIANPILRPCQVDLVTLRQQVPVHKDRDGGALTNILGRPYDPPLMRWQTRVRWEFVKNVAATSYPSWYFQLADRINQDPFAIRGTTFDAKTLLFATDRIPDVITEGEYQFLQCRFAIEWTPEGWDPEVLQADFYCIHPVLGWIRIKEDGVDVATPRKLNEFGELIDSEDPDDAYYKTEKVQFLGDFSAQLAGVL